MQNKIYKLKGTVQHYQWGGTSFIPALLHVENSNNKPFAEYWLGAHNHAPAIIEANGGAKLNEALANHPEWLGENVQVQFGRLPYLLKVLDVKDMLSIQVHPAKD